MLYWISVKATADFLKQSTSYFPLIAEYSDLDQLVASEPLIHFMHNIFRQASFTYSDNRGESVSKCSEDAPANECKRRQAVGFNGNRLQKRLPNSYLAAFSVSRTALGLQTLSSLSHFFRSDSSS
jgi:hypothetical protein